MNGDYNFCVIFFFEGENWNIWLDIEKVVNLKVGINKIIFLRDGEIIGNVNIDRIFVLVELINLLVQLEVNLFDNGGFEWDVVVMINWVEFYFDG